jgi:hypothetical protein
VCYLKIKQILSNKLEIQAGKNTENVVENTQTKLNTAQSYGHQSINSSCAGYMPSGVPKLKLSKYLGYAESPTPGIF